MIAAGRQDHAMIDLEVRLRAALADRYRLERRVGAGGMAVVFLAHDLRHDRSVALKVLRPEWAAAVGAERFLREIQIAARLHHPHILALYDSGEADSCLYYVMPYVEGETLRDRLTREHTLSVNEVQQIGREVADALTYAHTHDVVHRDIKPENILLASGHAQVCDFGIARAISVAGGDKFTGTGLTIGTPNYMSPEQAAGDGHIDGRSDLYSLGIVLYEALVGTPPFAAPTPQEVIAKRFTDTAPLLSMTIGAIPRTMDVAISRVLSRMPGERFDNAAQFASALTAASPAATRVSMWSPLSAAGPWRWLVPAMVLTAIGLGATWFMRREDAGPPTIAILPFDNVGIAENEYFADGITEEMTSRLAEVSGLRVTSRTSAVQYKGSGKSIRDIGRELQVEYVLEGTVRTDRASDGSGQVRVTPQLIRVADDSHLWTHRYDASLVPGEIFKVQADIAEQVTAALDVALLEGERAIIQTAPTNDAEAYNAYLQGRFQWNRRTAESLVRAVEYFSAAIRLDSTFAAAWAGQADANVLIPFFTDDAMQYPAAFERAKVAAREAIRLAPNLAEAHASLGEALLYNDRNWSGAERAFVRAIELDPTYPVAHYWYAELLLITQRVEDAIQHLRHAAELAPAMPITHLLLGLSLMLVDDWDGAEQHLHRQLELQSDFHLGDLFLALAALHREQWQAAEAELVTMGVPSSVARAIIVARQDSTQATESARVIDAFLRSPAKLPFASPERYLYGLADIVDSTVSWLIRGIENGSGMDLFIMQHPVVGRAATDPRILGLRRQLGLPD
jgi:eukaryotic-like serine/threonine-protein kinase